MRPPCADQRRGNPHPHHRRCKRRMGVGSVRIQAEQVAVGLGGAGRQRPGPQFPGSGQPLRGHGLDRSTRPFARRSRPGAGPTAVRTSGVSSSVRVISACKPASTIISASASARHSRSTTTDSRAPWTSARRRARPGRAQPGSLSGRRPRAAPTQPRRTTAGSHKSTVGQPTAQQRRRAAASLKRKHPRAVRSG